MDSRQQDLFMTVSNRHCQSLYPNNSPGHFKICLDEYIDLSDYYTTCALLDISLTTDDIKQVRNIYICSNVAAEQYLGNKLEPLMRYTVVARNRYQMEKFAHPYYIPLKPIRCNYLEIYIKDEDGDIVSFLKNTTTCTLHFKK